MENRKYRRIIKMQKLESSSISTYFLLNKTKESLNNKSEESNFVFMKESI